jgi:putative ABC transport system permease protein
MTLLNEARFAWRSLIRAPGYAAAFVLTLGLGIGANTAIFSVVRGIWLRPLPHADGDRLVYLRHSALATGESNVYFSVPEIADIRTQAKSFKGVVEFSSMTFTVQGLGEPRRVQAGVVTGDYFEVMGLRPILGRAIASSDNGPRAAPVTVLTESFWRRSLGADPTVLGRKLRMNERSVEIVGVLEPAPPYPERTDIYVNMVASPHHLGASMTQDRIHRMTEVFARLAPGATAGQAGVEVDELWRRLQAQYPDAYDATQKYAVSVTPLRTQLAARASTTVVLLLAVTGLVLIIACANVANLTLARVMRRQGELATRVALGASAWQVRRLLLVESLIPSLLGALLGCAIADASVGLLAAYAARYSARAYEIEVDGVVLSVALLLGLLAGVFFALVPRLPSASTAASWVVGARVAGGASGRRIQRLLVVSQVAVCCVLLVGAGLLLRTLQKVQAAEGGVELKEVLAMEIPGIQRSTAERANYKQTILERVRALPGVRSAAFGSRVPFGEVPTGPGSNFARIPFEVEGQPPAAGAPLPRGDYRFVSPAYFETVGLSLLSGRLFDDSDRKASPPVVIVNRALARRLFGNRDAVGHRLAWRDPQLAKFAGVSGEWRTIVGVVSDSKDYGVTAATPQVVYQAATTETALLVRTATPASLVNDLIRIVRQVEPDQPIERVATLAERREERTGPERLNATLLAGFGLLALVISAVGVAGVLAFGVSQRFHELGIRAALGADPGRLMRMVVVEGGTLTLLGLVIGGAGAAAGSQLLSGLLFGVAATDALTFTGVAVVMMAVAVTASLAPAWRASSVDPARALRAD